MVVVFAVQVNQVPAVSLYHLSIPKNKNAAQEDHA